MKLKKGDKVLILSGVDKGKEGRVLQALPKKDRVLVEGVNVIKRHTKPRSQGQPGGIIEKEAPVHVSKVAFVDPNTGKAAGLGVKVVDGRRVRVSKVSNEVV
ncbi:MAG: 50S ribosomal protein L24 [bacterium]|jgi:large subunit ribosomal protein L24|nr:50S ribosomal protein L24 [bacterium]